MTRNARFIVLEGLDGAGTTTQAARLQAYFTNHALPSFITHEPTSDPIGTFIRRILTGHERSSDGSVYHPGEHALGLMFAADRRAHSRVIEERLKAGERVVCDRYLFSSLAYQTLDRAVTPDWVIDVNQGCAIPDVTFFLAVPVEECLARLAARRGDPSIYETRSHLHTIAKNYERLLPRYEAEFGRVVRIDGTLSIDDVQRAILEELGES